MREHGQELVLAAVRVLELSGAFGDALFQIAVQPLELVRLHVELDERVHLRAQNLRDDRHLQIIHRADFVALQPIEIGEMHAGHEDDRRAPEAGMVANHLRQLEAVEFRHADVHNDDGELGLEKLIERFPRRVRRDEVRVQPVENGAIAQELRGLVVDHEHIRAVIQRHR